VAFFYHTHTQKNQKKGKKKETMPAKSRKAASTESTEPEVAKKAKAAAAPMGKPGAAKSPTKRKRQRIQTYNSFIAKVLKEASSGTGINTKAMKTMNDLTMHLLERLAKEAATTVKKAKGKTLDHRSIHAAVRFIMPNELAKNATEESCRALKKFKAIDEKEKCGIVDAKK
jgi:histone H3/H4